MKDMVMDLVETHMKELEKKGMLPKGNKGMTRCPLEREWRQIDER